ncbi:MAG TPA: Gfo/Idh/MocA family oxidoreductase, partial [Candidatus Latescibacteria bacterium]|nr:Gfo/Idh/MocA family oxidoreductase [Candidatus Latescibacterota bacterium]
MALASARAGKHIFCEKPMALSVASCDRMIAAAEDAGVKLMVGQVLRYIPRFAKIKEIVDSGVLGGPFAISIVRMGRGWGAADVHWRRRRDMVGGVLFEVSVHELDFMCYIMGEVERVAAFTGRYIHRDIDYEDTAQVLLRFRNGGLGSLVAGVSSAIGVYEGKMLCGKGSLFWGWDGIRYRTFEGEEVRVGEDELPTEPGVHRELREFVEAVREGKPATIPGEEGRRAVEVVEAAYRSAETGREVSLPLEGPCGSCR